MERAGLPAFLVLAGRKLQRAVPLTRTSRCAAVSECATVTRVNVRRFGAAMLFVALLPTLAAGQVDTSRIRDQVRTSAASYELALRRFAPFLGRTAPACNEMVGRFCLIYDHGKDADLPVESAEVREARNRAISALSRATADLAHDTLVAGPLVRLLVEAGHSQAAVESALRFAMADSSDAWSYFLLGLALNADGRISASEVAFDAALERTSPDERHRAADAFYLLSSNERESYRRLPDDARASYLAELWRASDPLYLTPGNEVRAEHFARYVYTRLLSRVRSGGGIPTWGADLEELTRRFGVPVGTGPPWPCVNDVRINNGRFSTEFERARLEARLGIAGTCEGELPQPSGIYHPDLLTYVPPDFGREKLPPQADPGTTEWFYGPVAERNGFLPRTLWGMHPLEHQISRFPGRDSSVLRADVELRHDVAASRDASIELGLFVLDSALEIIAEARDTVQALGSLASGWLETRLPPGAFGYSVEARNVSTGFSARARHPLPLARAGSLEISDAVVLPGDAGARLRGQFGFRPFGSLLLEGDQEISVYLEIVGLEPGADGRVRYRLDLGIAEARDGPVRSPRVSWTGEARHTETVPVAVSLGRLPAGSGIHRLVFTVTDATTGANATVERLIRIK